MGAATTTTRFLRYSAAFLLTGCPGDKDDTGDTSDTGDTVVTFYVADPNDPALGPLEGVTVAVDTMGGERQEVVSGADGTAVFTLDVDEFAGVIGHADGRSFTYISREMLIADLGGDTIISLWSWPISTGVTAAAQEWYAVSGAILNTADAADVVLVTTTIGGGYQDVGDSYEVEVAGGVPFTMVALDYTADPNWGDDRVIEHVFHHWWVHEQPALSGPITVNIDFASSTAPVAINGSMAAPDGSATAAELTGALPVDGAQDLGLLAPPRRTSPEGSGPFAWDEPIVWNAAAEGQVVRFTDDLGGVGLAFVGPEETSYTLPPPPSTSTWLGTGSIYGTLGGCTSDDEDPQCERSSNGAPFEVLSPFAM